MRIRTLFLVLLAVACQKTETTNPAPPPPRPKPAGATAQQITQGLQTPESVLYDAQQDVYFVSNINGEPLAEDNNGFISRVTAETLQIEPKWIDSSKKGVTLNGPKGMAILGEDLYVADINVVRRFDRISGVPKGGIAIPGSTFLNDLTTDGTSVYVSDSGLKAGAGGNLEPTGSDAIWKITGNTPEKVAGGEDLKRPNGLDIVGGKVWAVSFGSNKLYEIDNGTRSHIVSLPKGSLDGLVHLEDGTFLVSSWDGKAVYRGAMNGPFQPVVENVNAPADIGYDSKRHLLLIPHFMDNVVSLHPLQ